MRPCHRAGCRQYVICIKCQMPASVVPSPRCNEGCHGFLAPRRRRRKWPACRHPGLPSPVSNCCRKTRAGNGSPAHKLHETGQCTHPGLATRLFESAPDGTATVAPLADRLQQNHAAPVVMSAWAFTISTWEVHDAARRAAPTQPAIFESWLAARLLDATYGNLSFRRRGCSSVMIGLQAPAPPISRPSPSCLSPPYPPALLRHLLHDRENEIGPELKLEKGEAREIHLHHRRRINDSA